MKFSRFLSGFMTITTLSYMVFMGAEAVMVKADTATSTSTSTLPVAVSLSVTTEIDLSCPASVSLAAISGLTGGTSANTADCNVKTNSANGYNLFVHVSSTPALTSGGNSFADHTSTSTPQYTWSSSQSTSTFGFAASSTDVVANFKNDGGACNTGSNIGYNNCFRGFNGASDITVSHAAAPTGVNGVTTTLNFKAEVGNTAMQPAGSYTANVTVTAVAL